MFFFSSCNILENSKNVQFRKFRKYLICLIWKLNLEFANLENYQIFEIVKFKKLTNFQNLTIFTIEKKIILPFGKSIFYNLKNY